MSEPLFFKSRLTSHSLKLAELSYLRRTVDTTYRKAVAFVILSSKTTSKPSSRLKWITNLDW